MLNPERKLKYRRLPNIVVVDSYLDLLWQSLCNWLSLCWGLSECHSQTPVGGSLWRKKRALRFSGFLCHFYCCFLTLSLKYSLCYLNGTSVDWLSSLYLIVWKVLVKSVRPWRPSNLLSAIEPERHYVLGLTCLFYLQLYVIDKNKLTYKWLGWM